MGVAATLQHYLSSKGINFRLIEHPYSEGSFNTAQVANVPLKCLAKAVLFRDEDFNYTLAVVPATNKVRRYTFNQIFDRHMELATEEEIDTVFSDCCHGAVPPIGKAYNVNVIWDDELGESDCVWIEAGDHEHLVQLDTASFKAVMDDAMHDHFSSAQRYRRPPKAPREPYQFSLDY